MKTFNDLRKLDVGEHIEKKNGLSYLSWSWAVDVLLQNDPSATWEFPEPKYYGDTVMVYCDVTAFGKTMKMHLPVMDLRNKAIVNPNTTDINKAMKAPSAATEIVERAVSKSLAKSIGFGFPTKREIKT